MASSTFTHSSPQSLRNVVSVCRTAWRHGAVVRGTTEAPWTTTPHKQKNKGAEDRIEYLHEGPSNLQLIHLTFCELVVRGRVRALTLNFDSDLLGW